MFSSWASLFKTSTVAKSPTETPQCLHEISNDWICVDEQTNCETVDDLGKHEILDEETKQRRLQWQKRLQKGRSKRHNSVPHKAKFRRATTPVAATATAPPASAASPTSQNNQQAQLRAKLRLAVEAAGVSSPNCEEENCHKSTKRVAKMPSKKITQRGQSKRNYAPIQQPCQRGMN